jgi:hypothetical protein
MANTRMKDFYDLWRLSQDFDFDGTLLIEAIESTFKRRGTEVPVGAPLALTDEFSRDSQKAGQWQAFLKKSGLEQDHATLQAVAADLAKFLAAPMQAVRTSKSWTLMWPKGGPWRHSQP